MESSSVYEASVGALKFIIVKVTYTAAGTPVIDRTPEE